MAAGEKTEAVERFWQAFRTAAGTRDGYDVVSFDDSPETSRKINYLVVPYRAITSYSIETAGTLDMDSELKIWTSGRTEPIQKTLKRGANIRGIQAAIAAAL